MIMGEMIMSKVLQMIDYEHLMYYEQLIRIELMIEEDMRKAGIIWETEKGESPWDDDPRFKSYVNPDGPMAQAGFLEDEPSSVNYSYDDIPF